MIRGWEWGCYSHVKQVPMCEHGYGNQVLSKTQKYPVLGTSSATNDPFQAKFETFLISMPLFCL